MDYKRRFQQVLNRVEATLDQPLSVEALSEQACLSRYHFHRLFTAHFGITVWDYVVNLRMKRAAYLLAFRQETRVLDIALSCGYGSSEAFSRAFKCHTGFSPNAFRSQPDWASWQAQQKTLLNIRRQGMPQKVSADSVSQVDFPELLVGVLPHRGAPAHIGDSIRRFIQWRKQQGLSPTRSRTFNLLYDDPEVVSDGSYRLDLCVEVDDSTFPLAEGMHYASLAGGRCARLRHIGSDDTLGQSIQYLYGEWLTKSGATLRDCPLFLERVTFFPDVMESEAVTDIYLPLV